MLDKFFDEFFKPLRTAEPSIDVEFLLRVEKEFVRLGYREKFSAGVENILIVRLDVIGDMILTSGFLREVRANFPQARITLICSPLTFPIVELCPYVNEVLTFDKKTLDKNFPAMIKSIAEFCRDNLWDKNFSVAFSSQWGSDNLPALFMAWLSGARERIGYGTFPYVGVGFKPSAEEAWLDNFLLTQNIMTPRNVLSDVEKSFYLLTATGLTVNQTHMELFFGKTDFFRAQELLRDIPSSRLKVLLGIGAGFASRCYPVEKFLVALKILAEKNLTFIIIGGQKESNDAAYLEQNLPHVINLAGKTTLRETEAVIAQADYYIGNDSGVMHMASAAQVPCLVLYRDAADKEDYFPCIFSESERFPPWQTNSVTLRPDHQLDECARLIPIYGWCHSDKPHCITQITPQEIVAGFEILCESH